MSGSRQKQLNKQRKEMEKAIAQMLVDKMAEVKVELYSTINKLPFRQRFAVACKVLLKKL